MISALHFIRVFPTHISIHSQLSLQFTEGEYYAAESFLLFGTLESARVLGRMASEWSIKESDAPDPGYFIARETLGYS